MVKINSNNALLILRTARAAGLGNIIELNEFVKLHKIDGADKLLYILKSK